MLSSYHLPRGRLNCASMVLVCFLAISDSVMAQDKSAADYFVRSLPGQPKGPLLKMHAGHITVNPEHHGNLFFWHFQNRHIANRHRTVIWLNGGPGCSSMDGALMEVGPYRVQEGGKLGYRDGAWDEFANILFVDNPVGTGYSYVDTDSFLHELPEMSGNFLVFLEKFFNLFPEYESDDLYIAGESYAGQYIPYIAQAIVERNKDPVKQRWNLRGLLIGNGWISPPDQYLAYLPYAYKEGLIQGGSDIARRIEGQQAICAKQLSGNAKDNIDTPECEKIMLDILDLTKKNTENRFERCVNMYDVRLRDDDSCGMNWPPDLERVTPYLRLSEVRKALNVDPDKVTGWQECSGAVSRSFRAKNSKPAVQLLPELLKEMSIVLFSGEKDLICNHLGTEGLISNMEWNGGRGFEVSPGVTAPRRDWEFEGEAAGIYQEARNLTYILFYNSSHMVPFDYPRRSRSMLDRFMDVDITSIGGKPTDSRIDGEKDPETSVEGHTNSTNSGEQEKERLQEAKWEAYQRSGEVVLVVVIILAAAFGWWVWRGRQKRAQYHSVSGNHPDEDDLGHDNVRIQPDLEGLRRSHDERDIEVANYHDRDTENGVLNNSSRDKQARIPYDPTTDSANGNKRSYRRNHSQEIDDGQYSIGQSSSDGEGIQLEKLSV